MGLPSETIGVVMPNDGASTFLDDHSPGLLNKHTVALAHLVAGAAHVIETLSTILGWRWHERALHLRCRGSGRRSWWAQRRGSNGGFPERLLGGNRRRRLHRGTTGPALTSLLRARRSLRSAMSRRLRLLLLWRGFRWLRLLAGRSRW